MRNGVSRALLAAAALSPALSQAQQENTTRPQSSQFNYSYVELAYDESDFDLGGGGDIDGDGLTLSGSFEINDEWHVFASYGNADLDFGIDIDTWAIGGGYAFPLRDDVDIYGRVLYINTEADVPGPGDPDEDGLGLQARIRAMLTDELEVEGGIQHLDVGDSDTSLQVSARYHFTSQLSAGIGLTFAGDTDGLGINARFSF
jgi:hypothetical protein